jgi:hypothetical protein
VQENADLLIERLKAVSCGFIPFFTSDQLFHQPVVSLNSVYEKLVNYGRWAAVQGYLENEVGPGN